MNKIEKNPYVGARTFETEERELFFGREREALDLLSLVISDRLVLFYAQSGAGKSSLINTKLIPGLIEENQYKVLPVSRLRRDEAVGSMAKNIYIYNLITSLTNRQIDEGLLSKLTLSEYLSGLNFDDKDGYSYDENSTHNFFVSDSENTRKCVLIIDQFEELFTTYEEEWEKREDFFKQLAKAMEDFPRLWIVFVMREDYIAYLDPYTYYLPGRLRTRYYMQRLDKERAIEAVEGPVGKRNRSYADGVAQYLVDELSNIMVRKPDNTWEPQPGQYVEPVQLQVVCSSLWEKLPAQITQITMEDLEKYVGDMNQALGNFYEERVRTVAEGKKAKEKGVKERDIRRWFEEELIIDGKRRDMVAQEPGGKSGGLDDAVVREFLGGLVREEKRGGGATFYELTHDRMVEPIIENNKEWDLKNSSPFKTQAKAWKESGRKEVHLIGDQALITAEQWARDNQETLIDIEHEYLEVCRAKQELKESEEKRQREEQQRELETAQKLADEQARSAQRARRFNAISVVLVVIAILTTIYAFSAKNTADLAAIDAQEAQKEAQHQSDIARSSELSTIALERFSSQLDLAILLGVEADSISSTPQTQKTLLALLQKSGRYLGSIKGDEYIQEMQYSPDGKILASRDKNGIIFWNGDSLKPLNDTPLNGHFNGVTALAISKDGKLMASGASDGTIVIWDAVKRQVLSKPIKAYQYGQISSLAFSMDGKNLASANLSDPAIILWDISNPVNPTQIGEPLSKHTSGILSIAFNPDGKTLASSSYDYSIILWDLTARKSIGEPIRGHTGYINSIAFNSEGTVLASASDDTKVILWDVKDPADPKSISELQNGTGYSVKGLAISPDDQFLVSGNSDGLIILWNISEPENPVKIEERVISQINSSQLAFSTDGRTLALSTYDGSIVLVDVISREPISEPAKGGTKTVSAVVFGPDESTMITSSYDSTISFWDISDRTNPRKIGNPLQGHPGQPSSMYFSSDGGLLASQGEDGTFLLDVKTQKQIGIGSFLTSPDGSILAYLTLDKITDESTIHLVNTDTNEVIGDSILGQYPSFSPDSKKLVFQTYDKDGKSQFHLWDIAGNKELDFPRSGSYVTFSPDSQILLYGTTDQATDQYFLNLWDIDTARIIGENIKGWCYTFSPDSQTLVCQTTDQDTNQTILNLWDTATARNIGKDIKGSYLAISSDSQTLVYQTSNSDTGEVLIDLWDIAKAVKIKSIVGSSPIVSRNGKVLAFVTSDPVNGSSFINLVDTATGKALIQPVVGGSINFLSANGKIMLYSAWNSIYALNTVTGENLFNGNINIYRTMELSQVLVSEFNDYNNNGETSILLIDTITGQKIGEPVKGSHLKLSQDGEFLVYQTVGKNGINNINLFDVTNAVRVGEPVTGNYMTISEDGKILATRSEANTIVFWDATKSWPFGEPVTNLPKKMSSTALSLDGSTLAWVDKDGITVQDVTNGALISGPFMNHFKNTNLGPVSISPNGKIIAITNMEDSTGNITLWDITTGKSIGQPIDGAVLATFSPDSKALIILGQDIETAGITIWDITDMTHVKMIGGPIPGFFASFSPDGKRLVVSGDSENETLKLWDLDANELINDSIPGAYATFSPDGKMLAVVVGEDADKTTIWDMTTFQLIDDSIPGGGLICFSPDGNSLAIGNSEDNSITLWDLITRKVIGDPIPGAFPVRFSQNGKILVVAGENFDTIVLWDLSTHKQIGDTISRGSNSNFLNFPYAGSSSDDKIFAFFDKDNKAILWDVETNTKLSVPKYPGEISGMNLNQSESFLLRNNFTAAPDANILAIYGNQGIMLWDLDNNKELGKLIQVQVAGSVIPATNVIVSPNGKIVASFAEDGIVLRDLETNIDTHLESSTQLTSNMIFGSDGTRFTALDIDNTLISWDVTTGKQTISIEQPLEGLSVIRPVFSPDGKYLAYETNIDNNTNLYVWDIAAGKPYIENPIEIKDFGGEIAFSPDGALMAYNDGAKIILRNIQTKEQAGDMLTGLTSGISRLSMIMEDNVVKYIVSVDWSGATQIWDWATRTKIGDSISGSLQVIGGDSQDHTVIYIDSSGRLIKWKWDSDHAEWRKLLCPLAKRNFTQEEWRLYFPNEEYPSEKELLTCPDYSAGK